VPKSVGIADAIVRKTIHSVAMIAASAADVAWRGVPWPKSGRMTNPRFTAAAWTRYRFRTLSRNHPLKYRVTPAADPRFSGRHGEARGSGVGDVGGAVAA